MSDTTDWQAFSVELAENAKRNLDAKDDEIDRLKAQLKEAEEKGRVLMDMCRDLKARAAKLESTGSTSAACPFCFDQMRNSYILRKQAEAVEALAPLAKLRKEWTGSDVSKWIKDQSQRLHQQADEIEKAGGEK